MDFPVLKDAAGKQHWSHGDSFCKGEYVKSFIHHDYAIGYHSHSFYELNVILSGEGIHYIEGLGRAAGAGAVFLLPPYVRHGYINSAELDVYHMLIHRDFVDTVMAEFKSSEGFYLLFETEPYLRARHSEDLFLTLSPAQLEHLKMDIDTIEESKGLSDGELYIGAVAKKILCQLCMLMARRSGALQPRLHPEGELSLVAECLNYIHRNFDQKLTVEHLASRLHVSRSTLIRQFTRICGCPPHRYLHNYRLQKARQYLKDPTKSLSDVAQECGFYDASHLRKALG